MPTSNLSVRPALASFYTIAGRTLSIQALDEQAAAIVRNFVSDFNLTPASAAPPSHTNCVIQVNAEAPLPDVPPNFESFEMELGRCDTNGETYYFQINDSTIVARPRSSSTVEAWIGESAATPQSPYRDSILPYALEIALRRMKLYQLHAAGVVEPTTGNCAVIVGASGNGKSTLALRLAASGWGYLSDDALCLTRRSEEAVEAWGLRRIFALYDKSLRACQSPQLEKAFDGFMPCTPNKHRLTPNVIFPDGFVERCVPRRIFFPSITGEAESRIIECSQSEAMIRLIKLCAWGASYDTSMAHNHLQVIGQLVKQSRPYIFYAGQDILHVPTQATALLTPYMK